MSESRIADLADLSTDDTFVFRVRAVDGADESVASGAAALQSDENAAANASGIATPDDHAANAGAENAADGVREAILLRVDGDGDDTENDNDERSSDAVVCWLNYCQHMTHIRLDKGSGAPVRDGEVLCTNHGAMFDADSGRCTYGPCEGAYLSAIEVTVEEGGLYLTDDEYEYVGDGPVETDDDRSSSSNVIL